VVVGALDPASGSSVIANAAVAAKSTGPVCKCTADPLASGRNVPAGRGDCPLGMIHIS
jgi:hypothetical protein